VLGVHSKKLLAFYNLYKAIPVQSAPAPWALSQKLDQIQEHVADVKFAPFVTWHLLPLVLIVFVDEALCEAAVVANLELYVPHLLGRESTLGVVQDQVQGLPVVDAIVRERV